MRPLQPGEVTLFGALGNLGQSLEADRQLTARGVTDRSINFRYKSFLYEKDYFNLYRGLLLKSFWDGRMDLGVFSHRPRGPVSGPSRYRPSSRYELQLRWNLNDR